MPFIAYLHRCLLAIEGFTARNKLAVLQDFWATVYLCNLLSFACMAADETISHENSAKRLKNTYLSNRAIAISILKDDLVKIIIDGSSRRRLRKLRSLVNDIFSFRSAVSRVYTSPPPRPAHPLKPHHSHKSLL
jgi:hypothetical protein